MITKMRMTTNNNGPVYCMNCLPREATFGQRLKARRLDAELPLTALGKQTGLRATKIGNYEQDRFQPKWLTLAKLILVLGVDRLDVR